MKSKVIKAVSLFTLLFTLLLTCTISSFARSNIYEITCYFTFTSDMNIDEGFNKIVPYILLKNGKPSNDAFSFTYLKMHDTQYSYKGSFSDGETYSIITYIKIIDSKYGTYVEAENDNVDYQAIVVTKLNNGATLNNCLEEAWKSRWVNRIDPIWNSPNSGTTTYLETPYTTGAGEAKSLIYQAAINTTAFDPNPTEKPSSGSQGDSSGSTTEDRNNQGQGTTINGGATTNPEGSSGNGQGSTNNNQDKKVDPVMIVLISIGSLLGLVLLYYLYKLIRMIVVWLKRK